MLEVCRKKVSINIGQVRPYSAIDVVTEGFPFHYSFDDNVEDCGMAELHALTMTCVR
jgi:hypothetical protein